MSLNNLVRRLSFLPLGLLWGAVAGWFHIHSMLSPWDGYDEVNLLLVPGGTMACTCLIATFLGSTMLNRELSSIHWIGNWVVTGITSCVGGVVIFYVVLVSSLPTQGSYPPSVADFVFVLALLSIGPLIEVATGSAVTALLSAPLSLLARWLVLRRTRVAEPAGGASQSQP